MAFVVGLMILSLFYKLLSMIGRTKAEPPLIRMQSFFKNAEYVDLHLSGHKLLRKVKIIGVSEASQFGKGGLPFELNGMIVLERENAKRLMIKAKAIQMIVESDDEEGLPLFERSD